MSVLECVHKLFNIAQCVCMQHGTKIFVYPLPSSLISCSLVSSNQVLYFTISFSDANLFIYLISSFSLEAPTVGVCLILILLKSRSSGPLSSCPCLNSYLLQVFSILKFEDKLFEIMLHIMICLSRCPFCSTLSSEVSVGALLRSLC